MDKELYNEVAKIRNRGEWPVPKCCPSKQDNQHIRVEVIDCPVCQGRGGIMSIQQNTSYICDNCRGTGKVKRLADPAWNYNEQTAEWAGPL